MKICKASSIPTPIYSQYSKDVATLFVYTLFSHNIELPVRGEK